MCDVTNSYALGMESRAISDYQISASDYYRTVNYAMIPWTARLNYETYTGANFQLEIWPALTSA